LQLALSYPIFHAIERALESNGLKIMILLRLSPLIPYNALDYISGVTSISLRDYTIALVGMLPGACLLCFAGASASSLSDKSVSNTVKIITIVSGILFGGCGVFMASYYSKLELDKILAAQTTIPANTNDDGQRQEETTASSLLAVLESNNAASHDTNKINVIESGNEEIHCGESCNLTL